MLKMSNIIAKNPNIQILGNDEFIIMIPEQSKYVFFVQYQDEVAIVNVRDYTDGELEFSCEFNDEIIIPVLKKYNIKF